MPFLRPSMNHLGHLEFMPEHDVAVYEDENYFYLKLALAGIRPEELHIHFEKRRLWVTAHGQEEDSAAYFCKTHRLYAYEFPLPAIVDPLRQPQAFLKNGCLKLVFEKVRGKQESPPWRWKL